MYEHERISGPDLGDAPPQRGTLAPGTPVRVANGFDGRWHDGFVVRHSAAEGYWLERSDGSHLPAPVPHDRVEPNPPPLT